MIFLEGDNLNNEQRDAIREKGSVFLEACPGSGKTRTLTYKIAERLSRVKSDKKFVIAITYTHRAADEILDRIEKLGVDTTNLWIGTIHKFCIEWILKPYHLYHEHLVNGFRIINSHETEKVIAELCKSYKSKKISFYDCGYYYTSTGLELNCVVNYKIPYVRSVINEYISILKDNRQVDFELILKCAFELLDQNPTIGKLLSEMFDSILIDEFQDTKEIQYSIVANILQAGCGKVDTFIVGDSNQAIYDSLGGYAISFEDYTKMTGLQIKKMGLSDNYRSSHRIVSYFQNYSLLPSTINAQGDNKTYPSIITFDNTTNKNDLPKEIARLIRHNIEKLGIEPNEICVIAPWWIHLASMTRSLVTLLPQYNFDGPGLVPFSRDIDNFWYNLSKILLTEPSPKNYVRRLRWANEIIQRLEETSADTEGLTTKKFLRLCNSLKINENDGLKFLEDSFDQLFQLLDIDFRNINMLAEHYSNFFESSTSRIARIRNEGINFIGDVATFKKVFSNRSGITVSTIHGVKGAEFDTVIAYALLDGAVPHFTDKDPDNAAQKLLYVISSRARKNLHLISESQRMNGRGEEYTATRQLKECIFNYDPI